MLTTIIDAIKRVRQLPSTSFYQDGFGVRFTSTLPGLRDSKDLVIEIMRLGAMKYCEHHNLTYKGDNFTPLDHSKDWDRS